MKKLLFGIMLLTSISCFGTEYICMGSSSSGDFLYTNDKIDVTSESQRLGTLNDKIVSIVSQSNVVYLVLEKNGVRQQARATLGSLVEYSEDGAGTVVVSVGCHPLMK